MADGTTDRTERVGPGSGRQEIEAEIAGLRRDRDEITRALTEDADTASLDSGDAAERLERQADVDRIDERIDELRGFLDAPAETEDQGGLPDGTVVTLEDSDGERSTVRVVAVGAEIAPQDLAEAVTADSPLGRALGGAQAGEDVTYSTPDGQERVRVISLDPPAR